ncbi:O-acetylhomoserine aminocarboxypropyltransferase/cysteine synthase family protein [candidate division KSB1 bacterium]
MKDDTIAIHHGYETEQTSKSAAVPIYQTVAYEFDDAEHGAALFNLEVEGNIYTRIMNPTNAVLEKRVAALENSIGALAVSAGSAAINYAVSVITKLGDNIVSTPQLYGGTYTLFSYVFPGQGVEVRFAADDKAESIEKLVDKKTKAIYCESIGNPAGNIADIEAYAEAAHRHGIPLIVDNTVATPVLLKPVDHGADIVVHSLTKYMGGHGNSLGGIIVDSGKFPWAENKEKFPMLNEPEPSYHGVIYTKDMGDAAYIARCRTVPLRNTGSALSPFNAFLILQGIETLTLRMERHCSNAQQTAEYLENHPGVEWVNFAGLQSNPYYDLAQKYMNGRASSIMTFGIKGGYERGVKFYNALELFKRLVNIGDAKSLACHPASTTHRQLTEKEQAAVGVKPEMIRLSVGIEHIDDIIEDLERAIKASE